jgi:DNA-binding MarR family transcriptional regulator
LEIFSSLKYNVVVPVGSNLDSTFVAIREFPTEKVFLVQVDKQREKTDELREVLDRLRISLQVVDIKGNLLEGMFRAFAQIKGSVSEDSVLVNVSASDNMSNCAALTAAFVNGLKAFNVKDDKLIMLPVLKFSYYRLMPERKLTILQFLKTQPDCCASLEELAARLKMSLPLCSYHINGTARVEGLVAQGLVETHVGPRGKTQVMLTEMGRMIAEGLVEAPTAEVVQTHS